MDESNKRCLRRFRVSISARERDAVAWKIPRGACRIGATGPVSQTAEARARPKTIESSFALPWGQGAACVYRGRWSGPQTRPGGVIQDNGFPPLHTQPNRLWKLEVAAESSCGEENAPRPLRRRPQLLEQRIKNERGVQENVSTARVKNRAAGAESSWS
ncbi:hypothetical protein MRX96_027011 [Rhipicephalus microplus]